MINIHTQALHAVIQMHADLICVDVRFAAENEEMPFPLAAQNIPWYGEDKPHAMEFTRSVRAIAELATPILLFCKDGARSVEAARCLVAEGFQTIYNLVDGCIDFAPRLIVDRYPRAQVDVQLFCV